MIYIALIHCYKLDDNSDEVTHPKQNISFFLGWCDSTISYSTYNPLDVTPVNVSLHSKLVTL